MILRTTFTYFNGARTDIVNQRAVDRESALEGIACSIKAIRDSLDKSGLFIIKADEATTIWPPALLAQTHIKFEIIEDE